MKLQQCALFLLLLSLLNMQPVTLKGTKSSPKSTRSSSKSTRSSSRKTKQACSADSCCVKVDMLSSVLMEQDEQTEEQLESLARHLRIIRSKLNSLTATTRQLSTDLQEVQTNTQLIQNLQNDINTLSTMFIQQAQQTEQQLESLTQGQEMICSKLDSLTTTNMQQTQDLEEITEQLTGIDSKVSTLFDQRFTCGGTGGWRRVVNLDMTDPSTNCPIGWQEVLEDSIRTCRKVSPGLRLCDSVTFPVSGGEYSRVCGRIKAYQFRATDAFRSFDDGLVTTIDGAYVSGVSLTHGSSPQQHIWTFATGNRENNAIANNVCPCDTSTPISIPSFVDNDYFCESGRNAPGPDRFFSDDPLWDGQNCIASSTCCSFNSPPYFVKQLPMPTTDSIEARLCWNNMLEDTPIEQIELYVQ